MINTVTFGVIAYNEHYYLPDLLSDLTKQTYPKSLIEVILVDGDSSDDTWNIMQAFQEKYKKEYRDIKVLNNYKRIQPSGWNIVINNTTSDILLRIDAHARLNDTFVEKNVKCINSGEYVCGGPRTNIIDEETPWKRILLTAEQSMFGSGIASYRQKSDTRKYVKSLFHAAYRNEVLKKVGLFNENLIRTEDNEYHYRVRKAGYRICYEPEIQSFYQTRNSLKGMLRQKYQNGLWIGKTLFICPGCISIFHLIPFAFVVAIILSLLMYLGGIIWPSVVLWALYLAFDLGVSILTICGEKKRNVFGMVLPVLFLILHLSYGFGTMRGILEFIISGFKR